MRVRWTSRYARELGRIGDYVARENPRAASTLIRRINRRTKDLSANPFIGRPGQIEGTRELVVVGTPYIVAYRVSGEDIDVLFVQHGAQEWPENA